MAGRLRVLIADDNPGIVKSVSRLLALDHDVVGSVADSNSLLEAARHLRPDLVVLDLSLMGVDCLEVCRQIIRHNPEINVIVFTANGSPEVKRRAFEAGACAFVDKLVADALLSAVTGLRGKAQ